MSGELIVALASFGVLVVSWIALPVRAPEEK